MSRVVLLLTIFGCIATSTSFAQQPEKPSAPATAASRDSASKQPPANTGEDWTKAAVNRSVLKPLVNGVSLGKEETPSCTRELVRLEWRHGDPIDIYVMKPRSVEKPKVVLYLYSFPADIDRFREDSWCQRNTRGGVAAVGFTSALTGVRFRNRPMKQWFVSELQESMSSSAHDVQLILDYLARRGDLSVDQVGIFGQGSGASIAILAASADPRIAVLDLLNPWGDWPDWLKESPVVPEDERARFMTPDFLTKAEAVDPVAYLPELSNRALRVQQVMDNPDTPAAARDKIAAATPHNSLAQFKDEAAHRESWKATGLSGWIQSQLVKNPQPVTTAAGKSVP